tara:strand:- start:1266 stop:1901 length:636 start_codon:yes stop_codon:yes gene_type:complete
MTDNPFIFDSEDTPYLKHHFQEKCWYRGKERIDANYFMIDPATILLGYGRYETGSGYHYVWQKDLFTPVDRPSDEYKKAFSVWVLPKYVEGSNNIEHPVSLWQRHSFGEYKGFQEMGASFYAESQKPENEGKLPVVKYTGSESISIGKGATSIPHFEFVGMKDRPAEFVIPDWYSESPSDNQNDDFLPKSDGDTKESHPVLDTLDSGDIPF